MLENRMTDQLFLSTLQGTKSGKTPIWVMRQAGRYLEEYRKIRANQKDFISFCLNPEQASAVTLQPIARYGFDAAIIFSDILIIPWAMNRNVRFKTGVGPLLDAMEKPAFLFDGRNILDHTALHKIGFEVYSIGKGRLTHLD